MKKYFQLPSVPGKQLLLLLAISAQIATAQTATEVSAPSPTPAPAKASNTEEPEETLMLDLFNVSAKRDRGFVAASSLAGGRLAGDLKDTPAAYSAITREFIDALNLTNVADAAMWSPNTVEIVSATGGGSDDVSGLPGNYSVRGASGGRSARSQRNFFDYFAPNDSYAVERFDFGRGPNAILFGNGSLGGVSMTMSKQARFDRSVTSISLGYGSWSNLRTTFDTNYVVSPKYAVRLAAVYGDKEGWRQGQMDEIRAVFLTNTFKATPSTTIRLEGEVGTARRNDTFSNLGDRLSGWNGTTVFTTPQATAALATDANGITRRGVGYLVYDPYTGLNAVMNYQNTAQTRSGGENNTTPLNGVLGSNFNTSNSTIRHSLNLPESRFDRAVNSSAFRVPSKDFTLASDVPVIIEDFKDIQLTVDQKLGDLFVQAAFDINRTEQQVNNIDVRGTNSTFIDLHTVLPNGAPNAHFLQPYADGQVRRNFNKRDAEGARLAAGYVLDADKWGHHTFNLMGGVNHLYYVNSAENLSIAQNADHRRWGTTGTSLGATDVIRIRRYWNEPNRPYLDATPMRYIDPLTSIDREITPVWALENDRADSQQLTDTRYQYAMLAANSKFFKKRLVVLGAVRYDKFYNVVRQQSHPGDYDPVNWNGRSVLWRPDAPADWASLTYMPRDLTTGVINGPATSADTRPRDANGNRQPVYLNDRFKDDYNAPAVRDSGVTSSIGTVYHATSWLSPFFNYAETFNHPASVQRLDGRFLDPTVAKGIDLGLRFGLLKNRIVISAAYYQNEEKNNAFNPGIQGSINAIASANVVGDLSGNGRNDQGFQNVPAVSNDVRDRFARGYEFEMTANITSQWRMLLNFGLPKVYETNSFQDSIPFLTTNDAVLRTMTTRAGVIIDANDLATVDTSITAAQRPDSTSAANAWNSLTNSRRNFVTGYRLIQDQASFNVFTDYTFGGGMIKGLSLGAGLQYRGRVIVGYRGTDTIENPANPATAIDDPAADAYTPAYSPLGGYYTVVATVGYTVKLPKKRELIFNLKVNNVLNDQGPIYAANSSQLRPLGGNVASPARETVANVFRYKDPVNFNLTTTLKF